MEALAALDQVAYVRFASVYRNFREAKDFEEFITDELAEEADRRPRPAFHEIRPCACAARARDGRSESVGWLRDRNSGRQGDRPGLDSAGGKTARRNGSPRAGGASSARRDRLRYARTLQPYGANTTML